MNQTTIKGRTHVGYKLTNQQMQTHNGFQWELGVVKKATGTSTKPCSDGVLHYYSHPLLAILLNPIHADIKSPRLFKISCSKKLGTDELKHWCKEQILVAEVELPIMTTEQRVAFAIYCAYPTASVDWQFWADNWVANKDRTAAANAAANAAYAANAAANAANAAYAANAAAYAANAYDAKFLLKCAKRAMRVKASA